jgi:centromeric protein E
MDREFLVRMSYMEIYNEDINDLLVPEHRKLQIHESIEVNNPTFHVILITGHL